jgi:hypothetical protein
MPLVNIAKVNDAWKVRCVGIAHVRKSEMHTDCLGNLEGRNLFRDLGIDGRVVLKWILEK